MIVLLWLQLTINDFKLVPIIVGSLHVEDYKNLDFEGYKSYINKTEITICGRNPIGLLLNQLKATPCQSTQQTQ